MVICDNVNQCHDPVTIYDGDSAMRVICQLCKQQILIRKDRLKGVPERRQYAQVFKRDILQGNDNLFYKYYPRYLRV